MSIKTALAQRWPKEVPLQYLPRTRWDRQRPTYQDAQPAIIESALRRSQARPSGNWYPLAPSDSIRTDRPFGTSVGTVELVAWRDAGQRLRVGPGACPHLGAALCTGKIAGAALVCPWHGLRLSGDREFGWRPFPSHDDGVLAWVRLDTFGGETPTDAPILPVRPAGNRIAAVARLTGVCEPQDIIANRLDPWHGSWFHPYSFAKLDVLSAPPVDGAPSAEEDRFVVSVTFHLGRLGVPVIAEFTTPEPRTIVMRIVEGEGVGSVVETHAIPVSSGVDGRSRTDVLEVVIAHSDRPGFAHALRGSGMIRPVMRHAANRLWRDDLVYAERRYQLRTGMG